MNWVWRSSSVDVVELSTEMSMPSSQPKLQPILSVVPVCTARGDEIPESFTWYMPAVSVGKIAKQ